MKILITGAKGFIGRNFIATLNNIRDGKDKSYSMNSEFDILEYDIDTDPKFLDTYCKEADFVFHLAGVNRPKDPSEFMEGNFGFTSKLLDTLIKYNNTCPIMLSSSIQAVLNNPYGESKKAGEELLFDYAEKTGAKVLIYRFPNVFGKWCRPNYNSAVTTFCHNIANNLPITVNDRNTKLNLVYIDDVVSELIRAINGQENYLENNITDNIKKTDMRNDTVRRYCGVPVVHSVTLGEIVDLLYSFRDSRQDLTVPDLSDPFVRKLYSTYQSYLPEDALAYSLKMSKDQRGSFTEFIKTNECGQFSVNVSKPGITKGNHWHHSKCEKFLVVSGKGVIRFRRIDSDEVISYYVSGDKLEVVDIPAGYTHNIENLGDSDMVTLMWANECFDPDRPDTYYLEVSMKKLKLMTILGTRPEIIRLSEVIKCCDKYFEHILVHTGQNWDDSLNKIFFEDLDLRKPDYYLDAVGDDLGSTIGNIIEKSYKIISEIQPDALLVLGDTNSALSAISAKRLKVPVFHMEAGNRCFDENLPEETNRRIVDHIADVNLCYSEHARRYLNSEGCPKERTYVTGSPMAEVLTANIDKINFSKVLETLNLEKGQYILLSAHREENIDIEDNFFALMNAVNAMADHYNMPVIYSTHPRSAKFIEKRGFTFHPNVRNLTPFNFSDYNNLQINAYCVVSDSGTIPEEASFFKFPAVSIRTSTERPESMDKGNFIIGGITTEQVLQSVDLAVAMHQNGDIGVDTPDYMDQNVSAKVVKIIQSYTGIVNRMVWRKNQ